MIFTTTVNGIPCQCEVTYWCPAIPAATSGPPDKCHEAWPEEFEYQLLDRRGRRAKWLDPYITPDVTQRLAEEAHVMRQGAEREALEPA